MVTDIFIKSFNRPYYLDRCLSSIHQMVSGHYQITILDDGTPQKYLDKILLKYPNVKIKSSTNKVQKQQAIYNNLENSKPINGFIIPTDLWKNAATHASEYFIMTEDDVWISEKIELDQLILDCKKFDINLLKIGWLGYSEKIHDFTKKEINSYIEATVPNNLFLSNKWIMNAFFYNKYKLYTILYKLGKVDNHTKNHYWAINSILMGLFKKDYWLAIWKDAAGKVDEKQQLRNASVYYKKHKSSTNFIAQLKTESMKTTFQSSATNSYHEYGLDFDVNHFNYILNEAWLDDQLNALENFPKDFSEKYIISFLEKNKTLKASPENWKQWAHLFRKQYKDQGAEVE